MVIDARSSYLSTNKDVAYQIILDEVAVSESDNTSTCKIRVEVWSWENGPSFNLGGQCDLWIRDSYHGDWDMVSNGWNSGDKPVSPLSDTNVLELSDDAAVIVQHEDTGYCKMEIWARIRFWNSDGDTVIYSDEEWQGYDVILTTLPGRPQLGISCYTKSSDSIQINLTASQVCNRWWYSLDDGDTWVEFAQGIEGKTVSTIATGLLPRFTYPIKGCARLVDGTDDFYSKTYNAKTNGSTRDISDHIAIFSPTDRSFSTNGLGSLPDATSCIVTEERNGAFELELQYPVNGQNYNYLRYDYIIVANSNPYDDPEPFRIYSVSKPINGIVTVNAAHISYDLSKWSVKPFSASSTLWNTIIRMTANVDGVANFPFTIGTDVMFQEDIDFETYYPRSYRSIIGEGENSILAKWNCEMIFKEYSIWFQKARGADNGVTIKYSKNMTDFKLEGNSDNVYTAIRAFWYKEIDKNADWYEENKTKGLVETNPPLFSIGESHHVGEPYKVYIMDLSSEEFKETYWDEKAQENKERNKKPTPTDLWNRLREIWATNEDLQNKLLKPQVNITVSFVNLYDSDEYKELGLQDLEKVRLCDIVTVIFPKLLGDDDYTEENGELIKMKCVKTVYNVLKKRYDSIELGSINTGLASTISGQSHSLSSNSSSINHGSYASGTGGSNSDSTTDKNYIFLDYSAGPGKLISMDTPTSTGAKNVMRMDYGGLRHSSSGVTGGYETIISQSGSINANTVRTNGFDGGILKPDTVTKGIISSEYDKFVDGQIQKESKNIVENSKYSDSQIRNIHNMLYSNGINIGNVRMIKSNNGVDFIISS